MQYLIFGGNFPAFTFKLDQNEGIYTQSRRYVVDDPRHADGNQYARRPVKGTWGACFPAIRCSSPPTPAMYPNQEITIASTFPGAILPIDVSNGEIIAQKSAFLCATPQVQLSVHVVKGLGAGLFGGEGFILQKLTGQGLAFLEIDGSVCEKVACSG